MVATILILFTAAVAGANELQSSDSAVSGRRVEPYQEFIHKCGPQVTEKFWDVPSVFWMDNAQLKVDHFVNNLNYLQPYNFTLKERNVQCAETFILRTSLDLNVYESGQNATSLNFTLDGYLTYIYSAEETVKEIYFHKESYCVEK